MLGNENSFLQNLGSGNSSLAPEIKVYPNPTNDLLNIECSLDKPSEIHFMDITGRTVKTILLPAISNKVQISLYALSSGVYTYKIISNRVLIKAGKIVKE